MIAFLACAEEPEALRAGIDVALSGAWQSSQGAVRVPRPTPTGPLVLTRALELPAGWDPDTRVVLRGLGVGWQVTAAVDEKRVASDTGGLRPVALDLGRLAAGAHTLSLTLTGPTRSALPALSAWTFGQPREGEVRTVGEMWLEITGQKRIDDVDVWLRDGVLTAAAEVTGAEGEAVSWTVVRDGRTLTTLPAAVVREGVATTTAKWTGERWRLGAPALQTLVARLPGGETRQIRFGAREIRWQERGLAIDGTGSYLAVERIMPLAFDDRAQVAAAAAILARSGLNGIELHGAMYSDATLAAADELGLYVVVTPMCDGRYRAEGAFSPDAAWAAYQAVANQRIAEATRDHPSLALWSLEAQPIPEFPAVHAPFDRTDVPSVDLRNAAGLSDESFGFGLPGGRLPLFFNELAWHLEVIGGRTIAQRLDDVVRSHRPVGIGIVVPNLTTTWSPAQAREAEAIAYTDAVRETMAAAGVAPFVFSEQRGPATLSVSVSVTGSPAAGRIVVVRPAGQAPAGALTDRSGTATLTLDYAGEVEVGVLGAEETTSATLVPGKYADGVWSPGGTEVVLAIGR